MSSTHYFSVVSNHDLTDVQGDIARDLVRVVNSRFISGQSDAVVTLADDALDATAATSNEVQSITIDATGGTFTVTFSASTTAALAFNVSAGALQTALQGLASIGADNVIVSGSGPYYVQFVGDLAATNVAAMTTGAGSLTGGAGTATVATLIAGGTAA